jgi:hypothetical protein
MKTKGIYKNGSIYIEASHCPVCGSSCETKEVSAEINEKLVREMLDEWWKTEPFGFDHPDTYNGILGLMNEVYSIGFDLGILFEKSKTIFDKTRG